MFDIGWSELLLLGAIALIVVGPKDLPGMLRMLGQYTAKARGMARDFQRSIEDAAREADVDGEFRDAAKGLRDLRNMRIDDLDKPRRTSAATKPTAKSAPQPAVAASPAPEPAQDAPKPAAES